MRTEEISREQVKTLRKALAGAQKNIEWNKIDYNVGRGVINKKKYCLWTEEGYRINISVNTSGVVVSQSERPDPEYFKLVDKSKQDK